eukprot:352665-Chlamydomonas_euryale.AAC.3
MASSDTLRTGQCPSAESPESCRPPGARGARGVWQLRPCVMVVARPNARLHNCGWLWSRQGVQCWAPRALSTRRRSKPAHGQSANSHATRPGTRLTMHRMKVLAFRRAKHFSHQKHAHHCHTPPCLVPHHKTTAGAATGTLHKRAHKRLALPRHALSNMSM